MGEIRNAHKILVRKAESKRQLGETRRRWEENAKMNMKEIGCGLDSSSSGRVQWWTVVITVMNLRVP
jgi:hypothetical protein